MAAIITSWDDGDALDMRVAELLERYGMAGTFYITKEYRKDRLSDAQIKELAARHEIGAHTLTHPDLRKLSREDKQKEIAGSKQWLEQLIGKEVSSFCYPKGFYDDGSVEVVRESGFTRARTTELAKLGAADPFRTPTTLQVYPFPLRGLSLQSYRQRAPGLRALGVPRRRMYSWQSAARAALDAARAQGGTFHLWGHSWEVEKYGMWGELEKFLAYASKRL